ncbi:hypothetical protein MNEG_4572 [Monoraphidium neglectum]|uniref:MYND-type domain-containing protein n=1 Tax=Monoraphidium neglectum TaxID=145388 RepID=A0A0D2L959_9CHLO|nr:hypothetical protein MNEG_4572 [Monoraphidium neglectum]KIZ03389.1 hypothetical protein MNEG_4572 [Monoraphidium neglectum]|eukprot:XP_013902408.1 hypothetical protein MNEG_4572 [Monoraphidium neglectum]
MMALKRLMTCDEVCAAALQVPRFLDALCVAGARCGACDSLTPLHQLVWCGGPRVAARAACEPGLVHAAARVAGGGVSPKASAALGFPTTLLRELSRAEAGPTGPAESGESEVARENVAAATPAIADAAARGVAQLKSSTAAKSAVILLHNLLRADGTRPAAVRAVLAARAVPALLRLTKQPCTLGFAAGCILSLSRVEPGRAELLKARPAAFAALAAALRRTGGPGACTPPGAAACVVRAVAELIRGDKAAAAAFLEITLPGGVLPALARHVYTADSGMCHGAAAVAAALAEAAEAAGPRMLADVAATPGLLAAAATVVALAFSTLGRPAVVVRLQTQSYMSESELDEVRLSTVGDLVECLDRLTAPGAAAAEQLLGVEGLEPVLAALATGPAGLKRVDPAAGARVLWRLRGAAAQTAAAAAAAAAAEAGGEARGKAAVTAACAVCGRTQAEEGVRLRLCRGCRAVRYCSTACAKKDWSEGTHKQACKLVKGG